MRFMSLICVSLAACPALAQTIDVPQVQAHLKALTTMSAQFSQVDHNGRTLTGTLTLKRPGKIRFEYQKNAGILVVANGKTLNFIDYRVNQVSKWPIGHSPLEVLLDPNGDVAQIIKILPSADREIALVEAQDSHHPEYGTITLGFAHRPTAPAGLYLQGWVSTDSQGNRTTIRLSDERFNMPVSDEAFSWRDPRPISHHH